MVVHQPAVADGAIEGFNFGPVGNPAAGGCVFVFRRFHGGMPSGMATADMLLENDRRGNQKIGVGYRSHRGNEVEAAKEDPPPHVGGYNVSPLKAARFRA
jgi:hypothetical protein